MKNTPHKLIKNADVVRTVKEMGRLANSGKKDPEIINLASSICKNLAQGDYASEALALYYWVCQNIRYIRDPDNVELLKTPRKIVETGAGDCDDMAILLAALCMAVGNPVDFCLAGFSPNALSHVYCAVRTSNGHLVLDPVANKVTKKMLGDLKNLKIVRLTEGTGQLDAGIGALRHLGAVGETLFSVYDYDSGNYVYYESRYPALPATGSQRPTVSKTPLGIVPEDIAAALPVGAKKVGEGTEPKGIIATDGRIYNNPSNNTFIKGALVGASFMWLCYRGKK